MIVVVDAGSGADEVVGCVVEDAATVVVVGEVVEDSVEVIVDPVVEDSLDLSPAVVVPFVVGPIAVEDPVFVGPEFVMDGTALVAS